MAEDSTAGRKIAVVTVHGTNDSAMTDEGEKWFQKGSAFTGQLLKALEARGVAAEIVPFRWPPGKNSAQGREKAADQLADRLKTIKAAHGQVHIIGHSHGGNVANEAADFVRWGRRRNPAKERIDSVITVGTPYFRRSSSAGETIGGLLFLFFTILAAISVALLSAVILWSIFSGELHTPGPDGAGGTTDPAEIATINTFFLIVFGLVGVALLFMIRLAISGTRRLLRPTSRKGATTSITAIWHPNDEAIAFLEKVDKLPVAPIAKGTLFEGSRTKAIIWGVRFVLFLGALATYQVIVHALGLDAQGWWLPYGPWEAPPANDTIPADEDTIDGFMRYWNGEAAGYKMLFTLFMTPILFFTVYLLYRFFFGLLLEWFAREPINKAFAGTLKSMAFGRDGDVTLSAVSVESHTYPTDQIILQGDIHDRMRTNSAAAAAQLIDRYRWTLLSVGTDPNTAMKDLANDAQTWDSLIHTTYFDQPEVVEIIADTIAKKAKGQ